MQNLWDKKASNYQRFDGKISAIQQQIFAKALAWGIDFNGKEILDIGCGTGVWSIFLSKTGENPLWFHPFSVKTDEHPLWFRVFSAYTCGLPAVVS